VRSEPVDADTLTKLAGQLRRVLGDLRRKAEEQAPAPISLHEHLSRSAEPLDDDGEEGEG